MKVISFRRNLRSSLPKRLPDLLGGEMIDYGHHPWAGLYADGAGAKCTGAEHDVFCDDWRYDELKRQGVPFMDVTADYEARKARLDAQAVKTKSCTGYQAGFMNRCAVCGGQEEAHR